jgi:hypothetical protein
MKHITLLENWSDKAFNASSLSAFYKSMQKSPQNRAKRICKGKDDNVFQLCYGHYGNNKFFGKLPMEFIASSLLCVNIFFIKALRQWRQIREAMKRWNVNFGKKLKQWSDEAFSASKENRFITSVDQLCLIQIRVANKLSSCEVRNQSDYPGDCSNLMVFYFWITQNNRAKYHTRPVNVFLIHMCFSVK